MRIVDRIHDSVGRNRGILMLFVNHSGVRRGFAMCGRTTTLVAQSGVTEKVYSIVGMLCPSVPPTTPFVYTYELFQQPYNGAHPMAVKYFGSPLAHLPILVEEYRLPTSCVYPSSHSIRTSEKHRSSDTHFPASKIHTCHSTQVRTAQIWEFAVPKETSTL